MQAACPVTGGGASAEFASGRTGCRSGHHDLYRCRRSNRKVFVPMSDPRHRPCRLFRDTFRHCGAETIWVDFAGAASAGSAQPHRPRIPSPQTRWASVLIFAWRNMAVSLHAAGYEVYTHLLIRLGAPARKKADCWRSLGQHRAMNSKMGPYDGGSKEEAIRAKRYCRIGPHR
jgi:hypothetical protein